MKTKVPISANTKGEALWAKMPPKYFWRLENYEKFYFVTLKVTQISIFTFSKTEKNIFMPKNTLHRIWTF